jgi:acyl-CoA synthetase (NDP forming)
MGGKENLSIFLNPKSVAVIGASERPGSWGSFMMEGLRSWEFPGKIYAVNSRASEIYGITAFNTVAEIPEPVDLAILTIPEEYIEETIAACGEKGVRGITIITAGFGEAIAGARDRELEMAALARSFGMHLLGPNVSGTFNLHAKFNASASPGEYLLQTPLGLICQGGFAFYNMLTAGSFRSMGVGKFIHTGNECDLTVSDFLDDFGRDPEIEAILMYLETIRNVRHFLKVASRVTAEKPVVVYKAGRTTGGSRAARSHTGALAGRKVLFDAVFRQSGILVSPTMELMLPLGHALIERPAMRGRRVAVVTIGGSWGVALTDTLEEQGLLVPEMGPRVQKRLRELGMPIRASTRNPIDVGASGYTLSVDTLVAIGREILISDEVDALIIHGMGTPGIHDEKTPDVMLYFCEMEKEIMQRYQALEEETHRPVLIGSHYTPWISQAIRDVNEMGIRVYHRLDEIAQLLSLMYYRWETVQRMK